MVWGSCAVACRWFVRSQRGIRAGRGSLLPASWKNAGSSAVRRSGLHEGSLGLCARLRRMHAGAWLSAGDHRAGRGAYAALLNYRSRHLALYGNRLLPPPPQVSKPLNMNDPIPYRKFSQAQVDHLIEICPNLPRGLRGPAAPLPSGSRDDELCKAFEPRISQCATLYGPLMLFGKAAAETYRKCLREGLPGSTEFQRHL